MLLALLDRRRLELRDAALSRGRQLYEEKPHAFGMRLHGYWNNWHAAHARSHAAASQRDGTLLHL
jgi:hypothetical protein